MACYSVDGLLNISLIIVTYIALILFALAKFQNTSIYFLFCRKDSILMLAY